MNNAQPHLTVIYGGLTDYDKANGNRPFAGSPGDLFIHRTFDYIRPANRGEGDAATALDIRIATDAASMRRPFTPNSRFLLLGNGALAALGHEPNINKLRGICLTSPINTPAIATYHPIDCWRLSGAGADDAEESSEKETKDVGPTSKKNFLHWALLDYTKLMSMPWPLRPPFPGIMRINAGEPELRSFIQNIRPNSIISVDIETRRADHSLDCIGLYCAGQGICVPIYNYADMRIAMQPAKLGAIWRLFIQLFSRRDVTFLGHNLAFDLQVLCFKYNLPLPNKLYDTMLAMHREYPQLEKSLSHALSLYTFATRNHKADIAPNTSLDNFTRLQQYNLNDVFWTHEVYREQRARAAEDSNLLHAVQLGNDTLRTTLLITLTGARVDVSARDEQAAQERLRAEQLTRCLRILTGNPAFNPGSPQQLAALFYLTLNYPIDETTDTGEPATDAGTMYKLQLKQQNPLFPIIIAAKESAKAASMLNFRMKQATI